MGVKTDITLTRLNELFPNYHFITLIPTKNGIIDTTYIATTKNKSYILKHYERDIKTKVIKDAKLLDNLFKYGLNVSRLLDISNGWYIYEKLKGKEISKIDIYHIKELARFLSQMHRYNHKKTIGTNFIQPDEIKMMLNFVKLKNYFKYKKFSKLKNISLKKDGIIHGDIFKDNAVFENYKIGVFDFSDCGDGEFLFDVGVTLFGFGINKKLYIQIFINTYNQQAPKKLSYKDVIYGFEIASDFYNLKRFFRTFR